MQPAVSGNHSGINLDASKSRWTRFLDPAIFGFLLLFAITLPHSIKGAERAWKIAFLLWLLKLAIERVRPFKQPLVAPLLAYVTLSAISTILSPDPYLSWDRMKFVCLFLVGIVLAQNLKRLSQVRWLVMLLVLSGFSAAIYTGWQYTYGVGVRLAEFPPSSRLSQVGFLSGRRHYVVRWTPGSHTGTVGARSRSRLHLRRELSVQYLRGPEFNQVHRDRHCRRLPADRDSAPRR